MSGQHARAYRAGGVVVTALALGVGLTSLRYFSADPEVFFPEQRDVFAAHLPALLLHAGGGIAALVLGPWQFWGDLRRRRLRLHRGLGRAYLGAVLVGGVAGLYMAPLAYGGAPARLGFAALALAWLASAYLAYTSVRRRDLAAHRRWMIRCYALTFAAVTLRVWLPLLVASGLPFAVAYASVAWVSWVPNLLVVELYLRRERAVEVPGAAGLERRPA